MFKSKVLMAAALFLASMGATQAESRLEKEERIVYECSQGAEYAEAVLDFAQKIKNERGQVTQSDIFDITDAANRGIYKSLQNDADDQAKLDTMRIATVSATIIQINSKTYTAVSVPTAVKLFAERCVEQMPMFKRKMAN